MKFDEERAANQEALCSSSIIAIRRFSSNLPHVVDSSRGNGYEPEGREFVSSTGLANSHEYIDQLSASGVRMQLRQRVKSNNRVLPKFNRDRRCGLILCLPPRTAIHQRSFFGRDFFKKSLGE